MIGVKHNFLSDNQYGFRKHHSTAYALACLYDKISSAIENKEYTVGIFIDLSKAFDTVYHKQSETATPLLHLSQT